MHSEWFVPPEEEDAAASDVKAKKKKGAKDSAKGKDGGSGSPEKVKMRGRSNTCYLRLCHIHKWIQNPQQTNFALAPNRNHG